MSLRDALLKQHADELDARMRDAPHAPLLEGAGVLRLGVVPWPIDEFVDYLVLRPRYAGHVRARPRDGVWANSMRDVMEAPHFLNYAKSFTSTASNYFYERAHLWSLNCFYTDEKTPYIGPINGLHVDREAKKILTLFVLGNDTDAEGAQLVQTHRNQMTMLFGPRGTAWLADSTLPHCGLLSRKPRMLAWARFANCIPQAKHEEGLPDVV